MPHRNLYFLLTAVAFLAGPATAGEFPKFREVVIDPEVGKICYAVTLADVNGDGRQDIVAVTENRVLWYENPNGQPPSGSAAGWKKRVILEDQTERDNVCIDAADIDGDGNIDFALGAGWTKVGTIQWLSRGKSLDDKWNVHPIDQEPWLHRLRFADVLGTGKPQLVISPLNRTMGGGVRLTAFEIPAKPKTDRWPRTLMDASLNRMHNHWHLDLDGDGVTDTITASQEGVFLVRRSENGDFTKTQLGAGAPGEKPEDQGAGEIKAGTLKGGRPFIATVEPMHGNSVVVYLPPNPKESAKGAENASTKLEANSTPLSPRERGRGEGQPSPRGERVLKTPQLWRRHVLDDTLRRGHAVWLADLDGDGSDEIIIGHSDPGPGPIKGPGVYVYDALDDTGTKWAKHVIDNGGIAVEDLVAADLTGNGRPDIVAGGRATHNVKLYVNEGKDE